MFTLNPSVISGINKAAESTARTLPNITVTGVVKRKKPTFFQRLGASISGGVNDVTRNINLPAIPVRHEADNNVLLLAGAAVAVLFFISKKR